MGTKTVGHRALTFDANAFKDMLNAAEDKKSDGGKKVTEVEWYSGISQCLQGVSNFDEAKKAEWILRLNAPKMNTNVKGWAEQEVMDLKAKNIDSANWFDRLVFHVQEFFRFGN